MMTRWKLRQFEHVICTVLGNMQAGTLDDQNASNLLLNNDKFFAWAQENELATIFIQKISEQHHWGQIPEQWQRLYNQVSIRISTYLIELDQISVHLARHQIPIIVLKNGGIARGIYPFPAACPMGDLDTLVEKRHFRQAHQILLGNGYQFEFRSPLEEEDLEEAEQGGGAEYWKILPNGEKFWLELQWRPVSGRWIRPDQEPSAEELMTRSIPIEGTHVRLLAPEDNLLQVSLHTAKHTYVRAPGFRLHLDVERIVRAYPDLDWQIFVKRVKALQVCTAVYFSLVIPYELFETPIPPWVLEDLRPASWKETTLRRWIQKAGLFNPNEKKFSRIKYILFTALLYDDLSGLWRGIFPDRKWMRDHYQFRQNWLLPYYHVQRLVNLLFQRLAT